MNQLEKDDERKTIVAAMAIGCLFGALAASLLTVAISAVILLVIS